MSVDLIEVEYFFHVYVLNHRNLGRLMFVSRTTNVVTLLILKFKIPTILTSASVL
jgi:hypothetical protein